MRRLRCKREFFAPLGALFVFALQRRILFTYSGITFTAAAASLPRRHGMRLVQQTNRVSFHLWSEMGVAHGHFHSAVPQQLLHCFERRAASPANQAAYSVPH